MAANFQVEQQQQGTASYKTINRSSTETLLYFEIYVKMELNNKQQTKISPCSGHNRLLGQFPGTTEV